MRNTRVPMNAPPPPDWTARVTAVTARAERYLRGRQSPDGGFCFYRWGGVEEASLADTWHAVAAFGLLGVAVPRQNAVAAFLQHSAITGFDDLYHAGLALAALRGTARLAPHRLRRIRQLNAEAALEDANVPVSARLQRALQIIVLQRRFDAPIAAQAIAAGVTRLRRDGGWGAKPNLGDTWLAVAILAACATQPFAPATRAFVDGLQTAPFGFTATADSTLANLDTLHAGIRACAALGLPLRHAHAVRSYLLACQTDAGGFAATPDALPNIALTHRGLLALAALRARMESSGVPCVAGDSSRGNPSATPNGCSMP